jgi:hypothetical protein
MREFDGDQRQILPMTLIRRVPREGPKSRGFMLLWSSPDVPICGPITWVEQLGLSLRRAATLV